jgi:hypothetical protein
MVCDDSNSCTDDSCDATDGCVYTNDNTNDCTDADVCNGDETCVDGTCTPGSDMVCDDSNLCTDDTCDVTDGCVYTNDNTNDCTDADACNGDETCADGTCEPGVDLVCDDQDACTTDSCDAVDGCKYTDIPGCKPTWSQDIQPVVAMKCGSCHLGGGTSGGLAMDAPGFIVEASSACNGLTKGQAVAAKVSAEYGVACSGSRMPVGGSYLSADLVDLFTAWGLAGTPE